MFLTEFSFYAASLKEELFVWLALTTKSGIFGLLGAVSTKGG
jgi:hypothetical protein